MKSAFIIYRIMKYKSLSKYSKTDWKRLNEMLDEEIDTSDIPPLDETFFANAELRLPKKNEPAQKKSLDTKSNPL